MISRWTIWHWSVFKVKFLPSWIEFPWLSSIHTLALTDKIALMDKIIPIDKEFCRHWIAFKGEYLPSRIDYSSVNTIYCCKIALTDKIAFSDKNVWQIEYLIRNCLYSQIFAFRNISFFIQCYSLSHNCLHRQNLPSRTNLPS